ncbi:MAG: FAD-dependent oxidoreductase [Chloroflexi bacterium]|nr:FAD-dependent oxidoreductase [Chloroflexota bacterium]MBI3339559.1 FAD-dependent oxidoreductase [Chloroflexota bacterium]
MAAKKNPDLYNLKPSTITVYGAAWCPDCKRAKMFFGEQRVEYANVDIDADPKGVAFVEKINEGKRIIPTIIFPDGEILVEPSNAQLAAKLGLKTQARRSYYDTIIIGGGPSGLTAALYLAREGLEVLLIEKAGLGGQAGITQTLDNFPGFDEGIGGAEFAARLGRQASKFGVEILQAKEVSAIEREGQYLNVETDSDIHYHSKAVLLASGARYRRMDIPGENELIGINVHFCATCDGAFYKGRKVLVVGGGNSGFEEGLFLTKFASEVDILVNSPLPTASKIARDKVAEKKNMHVILNHGIIELRGGKKLEVVVLEDHATGEKKEAHYDGIFVFIGLTPNNDLLKGRAEMDERGFLKAPHMMTSIPGVFAAGDVRSGSTKQAASAAGEGASAALAIREYLKTLGE